MATRSFIGKKLDDDNVRFIYCHYDGNPEYNGKILLEHYDLNNIDRLLDLGDLSSLGKRIDPISPEHSFSNPECDTCIFYGRDRGEKYVDSKVRDIEDYLHDIDDWDIEYKYLLDSDGRWYCYVNGDKDSELRLLEDMLKDKE